MCKLGWVITLDRPCLLISTCLYCLMGEKAALESVGVGKGMEWGKDGREPVQWEFWNGVDVRHRLIEVEILSCKAKGQSLTTPQPFQQSANLHSTTNRSHKPLKSLRVPRLKPYHCN